MTPTTNPTSQDKGGEMLQNEFEAWMASSNYPEIADIALERLPAPSYDMAHDLYETMLASAPVPQNELLEAAKEAAIAMSAHIPSAVAVQHASVEWKRTYEAYHRLRTAIRNAEQGGRG